MTNSPENTDRRQVSRVLISVSDKTKITDLAHKLNKLGVEIVSTAHEKIISKWGKELLGKGVGGGKPKSGIQDAHEAIRPTDPLVELPGGLDESQVRV